MDDQYRHCSRNFTIVHHKHSQEVYTVTVTKSGATGSSSRALGGLSIDQLNSTVSACPGLPYTFDLGYMPARADWTIGSGATVISEVRSGIVVQSVTVVFTASSTISVSVYEQGQVQDSQATLGT